MKRLIRHPRCLAAVALALPLVVAVLSYGFYDDSDLACCAQLSTADSEDLLGFLRKMPRLPVAGDEPFLMSGASLPESAFLLPAHPAATAQTGSVLRC